MKTEAVPILSLFEKEKKFFDTSLEWEPGFPTLHRQFHINKLEDYIGHLKFPFSPHRQTVFDFLFLTKGKSTRSKGLDKYDFAENTFFFLPAYQISTHDSMSLDTEGFYCHFDMEIFNRRFINPEVFATELTEAGFAAIQIREVAHDMDVQSADEFWDKMSVGAVPLVMMRKQLGEDQFAAASQLAKARLRELLGDQCKVSSVAHLAVATKR